MQVGKPSTSASRRLAWTPVETGWPCSSMAVPEMTAPRKRFISRGLSRSACCTVVFATRYPPLVAVTVTGPALSRSIEKRPSLSVRIGSALHEPLATSMRTRRSGVSLLAEKT